MGQKKLWGFLVKKFPNWVKYFTKEEGQGVAKTGIKRDVQTGTKMGAYTGVQTAVHKIEFDKKNKAYKDVVSRFLLSRTDTTVSEAILTKIYSLHPNQATGLYEEMNRDSPTIKSIKRQMIEPIKSLLKQGLINADQYKYFEKGAESVFRKKFDLELSKVLNGDFKDVVTNLISKNNVRGTRTVDYDRLMGILSNKGFAIRELIVKAFVDVVNDQIVIDAKKEGTKALVGLQKQNKLAKMDDIANKLPIDISTTLPAFAEDIFKQLQKMGLITEGNMQQQFYLQPILMQKGFKEAIAKYNNRDIQAPKFSR